VPVKIKTAFCLLHIFVSSTCIGQVKVLEQAHAHNDYEHPRPLFDALSYSFTSVEADVHLIRNELYVAHATPIPNKAKTLAQLYLDPLDSLIKLNDGWVYKHSESPFYLMIDIKTNGEETYKKLIEVLNPYHDILTKDKPPLIIIISGNRPVETIVRDKRHWVALDGRPYELGKGYDNKIMPIVSIDFKSLSSWKGKGDISTEDLNKITSLAQQVHQERKRLRLWAIPDEPLAWETLLNAGVDLINTDRLEELSNFINNKNGH